MRNRKHNPEKHCTICEVVLTDANWRPSEKKRRYPKFECRRCSNLRVLLSKRRSRGVNKDFTQEDYEELFAQQQGNCAICGKHQNKLKRILSLDHNHKTGQVRGLLCRGCNLGIGCFEENQESLINAITYLRLNK